MDEAEKETKEQLKFEPQAVKFLKENFIFDMKDPCQVNEYSIKKWMLEKFAVELSKELKEELQEENLKLKNRIAELRGMYVHSAREAETFKQFCEQKDKQIEKMKCCHSCQSHKLNDLRNCQTCDGNYSKYVLAE